ncbi:MAG: hypothetical protein PHI06_09080 [Desulfobulbaceae bacterium]|nr:hypothetical protein [Desulfobulbaceae bacterium]
MADYDFVDSGDYVWVDTPGYEFVDSASTATRLKYLEAIDVSIIYGYRTLVRGLVMATNLEIYLGGGNVIDLQLTAQNADTGEIAPLTPQLMAMIEWCKLVLGSEVIDSAADGGVMGANQPFDNVSNAGQGVLSLTLGGMAIAPGTYQRCRLLVKFSNAALPKVINLRREATVFPAD